MEQIMSEAFMLDTGSGQHLVGRSQVSDETNITKVDPKNSLRLRTAAGIITCNWQTRIHIRQLDIWVVAWVLEESPLILSVGKLVEQNGFDFAWKHSTRKAFLTKDGKQHILKISNGVLMLAVGS